MNSTWFDYSFHIYKTFLEISINLIKKVLITERMEESLVLLADLLCWPLEWVTHLDLNVRKPELKNESSQQLNEEERRVLSSFLRLDVAIYKHFYRRFQEHLVRYKSENSNRMERQVRLLKEANEKVKKDCVIQQVGNYQLQGKFREWSKDIVGHVVNE